MDATATPLTAEDARILALESGPIRGHVLKVLLIEDSPGEAAVPAMREELARRLPLERRWMQRLVAAPGTPAGLAWQDDPGFDLQQHVRRAGPDTPLTESELRGLLARIMEQPLDRSRPLWTLDVIPQLTDGRWALVWKVHHCLADGMTMIRAGARLLWTEERAPARKPARLAAPKTPDKLVLGWRVARLLGYRGLVLREFRRVRELSPLAKEVGTRRTVAFTDGTLDELRALGKAVGPGITINDLLLAGIAGGLRQWLWHRGAPGARMKAQVPVSMHPRTGDAEASGNRDSFLLLELPLAEPDPIARVRQISEATRRRKNRHDARAIYALREFLGGHAPISVQRALQGLVQGPTEYSLSISNIPGPAGPIRVLGRPVDALQSVVEIAPRHALRVSAVSLNGTLSIGLCADAKLVPDLDVLASGIGHSIDELHERLQVPAPGALPAQALSPPPPPA